MRLTLLRGSRRLPVLYLPLHLKHPNLSDTWGVFAGSVILVGGSEVLTKLAPA